MAMQAYTVALMHTAMTLPDLLPRAFKSSHETDVSESVDSVRVVSSENALPIFLV